MNAPTRTILALVAILALLLAGCDAVAERAANSAAAVGLNQNDGVVSLDGDIQAHDLPDDAFAEDSDPAALATAIQQTVEALVTNTAPADETEPTAEATATVPAAAFTQLAQTLTAVAETPTSDPAALSATPEASPTPTQTMTAEGTVVAAANAASATPTATSTPDGPCLALRFITDVNYPDGAAVQPRQVFFKQWYIQNVGHCRWEPDYSIVYVSGDALGARDVYELGTIVYPRQYVTISAQMVAPDLAGYYTSYWGLQDDDGNFFGFSLDGENFDQPFYVQIYVLGASVPNSGGGNGVVNTAVPLTPGVP